MLKKIIGVVIVISLISAVQTGVFAKEHLLNLGLDFSGTHERSADGVSLKDDTETGLSVGYELLDRSSNGIQWGIGGEFGLPRELEDYYGKFRFVPIYGVLNVPLSDSDLHPYLVGRLGYNLFYADSTYKDGADLDGGLYYAVGIGIKPTDDIRVQLLYSINNGETTDYYGYFRSTEDIKYSKLSLIAGFTFSSR